jgi:hypothetical protein
LCSDDLLSSTFHRRLLPLLSARAIIGGVKPLLLAPAVAGLLGLPLLVSACGGSSASGTELPPGIDPNGLS